MKKKALQFAIGLIIISNGAFAQWTGGDINVNSYRIGNVGIGTSNIPNKLTVLTDQQNDGISLSGSNSKSVALFRNTTWGAWNLLTQFGDNLLLWKSSTPDDPNAGGLVIGTWSATNKGMRITSEGEVGIGIPIPLSKFHIKGPNLGLNAGDRTNLFTTENQCGNFNFDYVNIYSYRNASGDSWSTTSTRIENKIDADSKGFIEFNPKGLVAGLALGTNNTPQLFISEGGNVGIGTTQLSSYKLAVEGRIAARGVKVTVGTFADYVFDSTYQLRPLASLQQYINQNKHLPGIPSAEEVKKDGGIELGEMNVKLLEKIEELTLYVIDLKKENEQMKKEIKEIKEKK